MRNTADKVKRTLQKMPHPFVSDEAYQMASLKYAPEMADVIWEIKRAFAMGVAPEQTPYGASSTFILKDCDGCPLAVFKPCHYYNELIAYRLDHKNFAGVPPTVLTTLEHPAFEGKKMGSCQLYISGGFAAVEANQQLFDSLIPSSIRKMASLDLRVLNEDRHTSNILIVNKEAIPIDHGFILPRNLSQIHLAWSDWQPAETSFSREERSYISWLDPFEDRKILLEEFFLEEKIANRFFVATILLKQAVEKNFKPQTIARIVSRKKPGRGDFSHFELMIEKIKTRNPRNRPQFYRCVYEEVERLLDLML